MAEQSKIEWTDATWNPITGCTLVDDGCRNCYAADLASARLKNHPSRIGLARRNAEGVAKFSGEVRFNEQWLHQPLEWSKPRMIFVCAHGDLFHESVPDEWIDRVFAVMALCPRHTFQVLTKRPERAQIYLSSSDRRRSAAAYASCWAATGRWSIPDDVSLLWPLPNVWLGTSVSDQGSADARIPFLLKTLASVRFLSAEPLLGPIDLENAVDGDTALQMDCWGQCYWCENGYPALHNCGKGRQTNAEFGKGRSGLDWVIVGGESGRRARPLHSEWARELRDQCLDADVPFFFKQWGMWLPDDQACPSQLDGSPVDSIDQWDWSDADERGALYHWGDGTSSIHLRKNQAGRFLDGQEWNEVPR